MMPTTVRPGGHNAFRFGDIAFSSEFDNGNLARVEQGKINDPSCKGGLYEFRIWSAVDNLGEACQSKVGGDRFHSFFSRMDT